MSSHNANSFLLDAAAERPLLQPQQAAPEDYYQNNFIEIFEYVLDNYEGIIASELSNALDYFLTASSDAQRLFARLLTRKGPHFFEHKLTYKEVTSKTTALAELAHHNLIRRGAPLPGDWLLEHLTKNDLSSLFPTIANGEKNRELFKSELVRAILGGYSDRQIHHTVAATWRWCSIECPKHWQLVQLLYFGNTGQDWSAHILRDLGHVRYENVELSKSRFPDANALDSYLHERELRSRLYRLDEYPQLLPGLINAYARMPTEPLTLKLRRRSLLKLGKWCEQQKAWPAALQSYEGAQIPPSRERRVRIHHKQHEYAVSQELLKQIAKEPLSATELIFSQRFGQRGKGFQPPTTTWAIDHVPASVEKHVLKNLIQDGGWGVHSENALSKTLTGLIYWEAVFAPIPGAFTNPFQVAPHDLMDHEFASSRHAILQRIEQHLEDDDELKRHMTKIAEIKYGIANPLVSWGLLQAIPLADWLEALPATRLRALSRFLIRNLRDYRKGFPDLFVCYANGSAEFVEVKGPTDQLQPQQRAWFQIFDDLDISARIVKLKL